METLTHWTLKLHGELGEDSTMARPYQAVGVKSFCLWAYIEMLDFVICERFIRKWLF